MVMFRSRMAQLVLVVLPSIVCATAQGQLSTFDTDNDGWELSGPFPTTHFGDQSIPSGQATWDDSVGLPPGSLHVGDVWHWTWVRVPARYLGDRSAMYGTTLEFDIQITTSDGVPYPAVALQGHAITLLYNLDSPPLGEWLHVVIPIIEDGWVINDYANGPPATSEDIRNILGDLRGVYILIEWRTGADDTHLDNVRFSAPSDCQSSGLALPVTHAIRAFIDGRDQLVVEGSNWSWHHLDHAAVGRWNGGNEPTYVDGLAWVPDWPLPPPDEIRFDATSSVLTGVSPSAPTRASSILVTVNQARGHVSLVQYPSADNSFRTIIEFDDNAFSGPDWYDVEVTWTPQTAISLDSTATAHALPVYGTLTEQIATLNDGPPPFDPADWLPVQRRVHPPDIPPSSFRCDCNGVPPEFNCDTILLDDPLSAMFVAANEHLSDVDEVTFDNCSSAFYRFTFNLPENATNSSLCGVVNVDDQAVAFLNGNQVSAAMTSPTCDPLIELGPSDPCYQQLDAGTDAIDPQGRSILTWPTRDVLQVFDSGFFRPGENELVFAVAGDASFYEPTGVEFSADVSYDLLGDADLDGDLDLRDAAILQLCFLQPVSNGTGSACRMFDADDNGSIDAADLRLIASWWTGPFP